jgi:hypothetical protein
MSLLDKWANKATGRDFRRELEQDYKKLFYIALTAEVDGTTDENVAAALEKAGRAPEIANIVSADRKKIQEKNAVDPEFKSIFNEYADAEGLLGSIQSEKLGIAKAIKVLANIGAVYKASINAAKLYERAYPSNG